MASNSFPQDQVKPSNVWSEMAITYDARHCMICNRFFRNTESVWMTAGNKEQAWHANSSECGGK